MNTVRAPRYAERRWPTMSQTGTHRQAENQYKNRAQQRQLLWKPPRAVFVHVASCFGLVAWLSVCHGTCGKRIWSWKRCEKRMPSHYMLQNRMSLTSTGRKPHISNREDSLGVIFCWCWYGVLDWCFRYLGKVLSRRISHINTVHCSESWRTAGKRRPLSFLANSCLWMRLATPFLNTYFNVDLDAHTLVEIFGWCRQAREHRRQRWNRYLGWRWGLGRCGKCGVVLELSAILVLSLY